jgi:branched-chain amino acid transport system substrate-binding protein
MEQHRDEQGYTRREFVFTAGAAVAGLAVGGVIGNQIKGSGGTKAATTTSAGKATINVGGAFPLTGALAGDGQDMLKGLQLAVEDINQAGGVAGHTLAVQTADIESDLATDKIANAVGRLVNDVGVAVVCMGYMDYSHIAFKAPSETGVPLLHTNAYSGDADVVAKNPDKYKMIFQTCSTDVQYGQNFGRVVKSWEQSGQFNPKSKTIAIVTSSDPYSVSVATNFRKIVEAAGWKVTSYQTVTAPLSEWGPVLAKIRANPPDIVMNTDYYVGDLASFTKQFVTNPTKSLLYEQYGPAVPEYLQLVGNAGNGVVWQTNAGITPDVIGNTFVQKFEAKYGKKPGVGGPGLLYDQAWIWAHAAAMAGDPKNHAAVVQNIKNNLYRGVLGTYNFEQMNNTVLSYPVQTNDPSLGMGMFMYQIQNQKQVLIDPTPWVEGKLQMPPWMK